MLYYKYDRKHELSGVYNYFCSTATHPCILDLKTTMFQQGKTWVFF